MHRTYDVTLTVVDNQTGLKEEFKYQATQINKRDENVTCSDGSKSQVIEITIDALSV